MSVEYEHPQSHKIQMRAKHILSESDIGDKLLERYEGQIKVIKGPAPQAFIPTENLIILRVPPLQDQADEEQALDLAGALIEHKAIRASGFPDPSVIQEDQSLVYLHYRNLDVILGVFPIAEQLDDQGFKALAALRYAGLSKLYQAWKTGASREECANIYWSMKA